ncbi:hypothetical protein BDR03DRAFT_69406 [Suillus americanus]|nr:hypothetical protein BDR03DRAFT_69406 [Suillus americanus]
MLRLARSQAPQAATGTRAVSISPCRFFSCLCLHCDWPPSLIRVIQSYRTAKGSLQAVLVKHNIFYYTCSLFLLAVNVLMA